MTQAVSQWVAYWPVPFTPEMATQRIAAACRAADAGQAMPIAIERREDGCLLGWASVNRDLAEPRRGQFGYWLGEAYHGHGYMREAATAIMRHGFAQLDLDVMEAGVQPGNAASIAILTGCGLVCVGEKMLPAPARGRNELCLMFEVTRPPLPKLGDRDS